MVLNTAQAISNLNYYKHRRYSSQLNKKSNFYQDKKGDYNPSSKANVNHMSNGTTQTAVTTKERTYGSFKIRSFNVTRIKSNNAKNNILSPKSIGKFRGIKFKNQ